MRVVFVGPVTVEPDNNKIGGVGSACHSLLKSRLSQYVEWRIIDNSMNWIPAPGIARRGILAFRRVVRLLAFLAFTRVDCLLIFGGYQPTSFLEKGLMCLLGRLFHKRVILSIRTEIKRYGSDRWFFWFRRLAANCCDLIICQSETPARLLISTLGIDPAKTVVVRNWINHQCYTPPQNRTSRNRSVDDPVRFLFVGWLIPGKGPEDLLQAASILQQHSVDFTLVVCGQGPLMARLLELARQLELENRVEFRGWVPPGELVHEYWDADIFVLPTYSEGMPNAVLEAMAAGLPIVVTPISSIPDFVSEGENGLFAQPGDPISLANAMETLAKNPDTTWRMGAANIAYIQREHSIEYIWPRVAEILGVAEKTLCADADSLSREKQTIERRE